MNRAFLLLIFLVIQFCFGQNVTIENSDCFLKNCGYSEVFPNLEYGYLNVPEDYENPQNQMIKVAFVIIKSTVQNPKPDPVLMFAGGWGMPLLPSSYYYADTFPIKNRDLILFDYRGSGYSSPQLCPELGEKHWELIRKDLSYEEFGKANTKELNSCLEDLKSQNIDYRQYGTEIKSRDAVKLIEQIGYQEVNLYGISNGTMGIQGFIRAAENSNIKIRSVLSDSNVPMAVMDHASVSNVYKNSLENILSDCAANPDCNNNYPNLKERFYDFIEESKDKSLHIESDPDIYLNEYEINAIVHQLLYDKNNYKDIPLLLDSFIEGDIEFVKMISPQLQRMVVPSNGTSLVNYVYDWKASQERVVEDTKRLQDEKGYLRMTMFWSDFFLNDSKMEFNARDTIPVFYDGPALVYAGNYDPITPPEWSKIMNKRYSNSYYYEFPKTGHGASETECGINIYQEFIENPELKPDHSCLKVLAATNIPFVTSIYKNQKLSSLGSKLLQQQDLLWIVLIVIPFLISLIVLVVEMISFFKRKELNKINFTLALSIIIFILALGYYLMNTANLGGLTLLFGLTSGANWLPWLSVFILILTVVGIIQVFRNRRLNPWNVGMIFSGLLILITIFSYGIIPFTG